MLFLCPGCEFLRFVGGGLNFASYFTHYLGGTRYIILYTLLGMVGAILNAVRGNSYWVRQSIILLLFLNLHEGHPNSVICLRGGLKKRKKIVFFHLGADPLEMEKAKKKITLTQFS